MAVEPLHEDLFEPLHLPPHKRIVAHRQGLASRDAPAQHLAGSGVVGALDEGGDEAGDEKRSESVAKELGPLFVPLPPRFGHHLRYELALGKIVKGDQLIFDPVIDIGADVGDLVGFVHHHRLEARVALKIEGLLVPLSQKRLFVWIGVLEDPLEGGEGEVEPVKLTVSLLKLCHHPKRLKIVLEAVGAVALADKAVELVASYMAKGSVAKIVGKSDRLCQWLTKTELSRDGARYLGHFEGVGEAGAEVVAHIVDEDLGLVLEAAKGG